MVFCHMDLIVTSVCLAFSAPGWAVPALSASPCRTGVPVLQSPLWPFPGLPPVPPCLSYWEPSSRPNTPDVPHHSWEEEIQLLSCPAVKHTWPGLHPDPRSHSLKTSLFTAEPLILRHAIFHLVSHIIL